MLRDDLDEILSFIGAETLTDEEFDTAEGLIETPSNDSEVYEALIAILDSRELVSDYTDKLTAYYAAQGIKFGSAAVSDIKPKSNIFIGGGLDNFSTPPTYGSSDPVPSPTLTLTGAVTGSGKRTIATTLADMPANTIKGNNTGAEAEPDDLTASEVTAMLNPFTDSLKGLAPASGGGTSNFLRADGTWAAPSGGGGGSGTVESVSVSLSDGITGSVTNPTTNPTINLALGNITPDSVASPGSVTGSNLSGTNTGDQTISLTGDVTGSGTGTFAATIANDAVTYAKMQNVSATDKLLGRSSSGSGNVEEIACTQAGRDLLDDANAAAQRVTLGVGAIGQLATLDCCIEVGFQGNGSVIATGSKRRVTIPFGMTVTGWQIDADASGSIVVDVWKSSYSTFPPVLGGSIAGSEKPTLSSAIKNQDLTLTTWSPNITKGDSLIFNIDSASVVTDVVVTLFGTRVA